MVINNNSQSLLLLGIPNSLSLSLDPKLWQVYNVIYGQQ